MWPLSIGRLWNLASMGIDAGPHYGFSVHLHAEVGFYCGLTLNICAEVGFY